MLRKSRIAAFALGGAMVIAPAIASAPASAAPAGGSAVVAKASSKSTASCNGTSYQHNGYSYGWGGERYRVLFGYGSAGNIRMAKVYSVNSSVVNWSLGAIFPSNAVVESSGSGTSYCIEFAGTVKGVTLKAVQNGTVRKDTFYF